MVEFSLIRRLTNTLAEKVVNKGVENTRLITELTLEDMVDEKLKEEC